MRHVARGRRDPVPRHHNTRDPGHVTLVKLITVKLSYYSEFCLNIRTFIGILSLETCEQLCRSFSLKVLSLAKTFQDSS